MRTYRLQFSTEPGILQRRLEKAISSGAERILASSFGALGELKNVFPGVWALERPIEEWAEDWSLPKAAGWDEYHYLVSEPQKLALDQLNSAQDIFVLQPRSLSIPAWVSFLSQFPTRTMAENIFLEFLPWNEVEPRGPTVHEISRFLQALKFHFPQWKPQRRPGVEMWDPRISEELELEAGNFQHEKFHWHQETPQVSVVIPTYNNKYFVYQVLKHLAVQNFPKDQFEIVLVDDGGADETLNYIKTFGVPRGLQVHYAYWPRPQKRNRGDTFFRAGLSRNLGVRLSRGEHLVFLDSDILVSRNFLKKIIENLNSADVLQFPRHHIRQEKSHSQVHYEKISEKDLYIEESHYWGPFFKASDWMEFDCFWKYTCTYALALRKSDFLKAGRFKRFYVSYGFEDTELGYHLAKLQKKFRLVNEPVLHLTSYSQSEYQLSHLKRRKLLKRTAKQFFLSTLDLEVYYKLRGFMAGDSAFLPRFKIYFGLKDKTKNRDEDFLKNHEFSG